MKYNVIIVLDESRNRSYYYSYVAENGNIECTELPPYADPNKARACYWDAENTTWIYDAEKYAEIVAEQEALEAAAEQERLESEAVPSNAELADAVMELAGNDDLIMDALSELADKIAKMEGGE